MHLTVDGADLAADVMPQILASLPVTSPVTDRPTSGPRTAESGRRPRRALTAPADLSGDGQWPLMCSCFAAAE